jgi:hypothetical protein
MEICSGARDRKRREWIRVVKAWYLRYTFALVGDSSACYSICIAHVVCRIDEIYCIILAKFDINKVAARSLLPEPCDFVVTFVSRERQTYRIQ